MSGLPTSLACGLTRRKVLQGGGAIVVAFSLVPLWRAGAQPASATPQKLDNPGQSGQAGAEGLSGSLKTAPLLDSWIAIAADGSITVFTGKAELGQGIKTALSQVAAEELVVPMQRITLVTADTARTPNEGYTAGSHSLQDSGTAIRHAAAQVRGLLLELAATRLGVPADTLVVEDGAVHTNGNAQRLTYAELAQGQALHVPAKTDVPLRDPQSHTIVGKPLPRVDIPAKVTGGAAYVQDLRLPNMLHARVLRPPGPHATLEALPDTLVAALPGVRKVVRDGSFVGVIAAGEWQAVQALRALAAGARWNALGYTPLPTLAAIHQGMPTAAQQELVILEQGSAPASTTQTLSASYRKPYGMHASIGPSCAVAQLVDGTYTVWTHSQGVYPLRKALAELLGVAEEAVHCIHMEGSGCYGHNGADDAAADAALLARALPGQPIRVQWMREDEHAWEPYGPPMLCNCQASLDASGAITAWEYHVYSNTHNARPGTAGELLAARHLAKPFTPQPPQPGKQPEGAGDRNAIPLYTLPSARVVHHFLPGMPLRVSALRSLGAYANVFAIESFMDELARAAGADPVAFRIRHMGDARAKAVMQLAADKFGWARWQRQPRRGRGFAFARYKNLAAYAAIAFELEVARANGHVKLLRAVAAVDSGEVVNPDGLCNQMEGGIIQAASWTLLEQVSYDASHITSRDWGGYPILRFPQLPESVQVHVIDQPGQPFLGAGEAAQGPTAAAIANAIADATGVRCRELPLASFVKQALHNT